MFSFPQIRHLSVVMSSLLLSPCNVPRHTHILLSPTHFELVRSLLYHPPSPTPFMLTSSLFIPPRCACVRLCFILSLPTSPRFDRHSPLITITPLVQVLFIGLVSIIVVFHTTHALLLQNPALLIFASLHTLPALPFTLNRQRSHHPAFVPSHPFQNLLHPYIQPTTLIPPHTDLS